jgi:hypothetical protein
MTVIEARHYHYQARRKGHLMKLLEVIADQGKKFTFKTSNK